LHLYKESRNLYITNQAHAPQPHWTRLNPKYPLFCWLAAGFLIRLSSQIDRFRIRFQIKAVNTLVSVPALRHVPDREGDRDADKPDAIFDNDYDGMDIEPEEDIVITIEEDAAVHNKLMRDKMAAQLRKRRKTTHGLLVGHHHGGLNPLPSTWEYPNEMNLIQLGIIMAASTLSHQRGSTQMR
jgi:hypothetical protein